MKSLNAMESALGTPIRNWLHEGRHRIRHFKKTVEAAPLHSIEAVVVRSGHCNSGHEKGEKFVMDVDGYFITKHCTKKIYVYLVSQLTVPVALINERLSERTKGFEDWPRISWDNRCAWKNTSWA
jgi:hypothetical protein